MITAFKFLLKPDKKQREKIIKTFGCTRFVYNHALAEKIDAYKGWNFNLTAIDQKNELPDLKKEHPWLKEIDSTALQASVEDLHTAFKHFYEDGFGFPNFKKKCSCRQSYKTKCTNNNIKVFSNSVQLPKLGRVRAKITRQIKGRIKFATVSMDKTGKFYVSITCDDVEFEPLPKTKEEVGLDLGLETYVTDSNGNKYANPRYLRISEKKLKKLQRQLAKKEKGSNNYNKLKLKLAKAHQHIANQRMDFTNKLSWQIVRDNDLICLETLNIQGMKKNHKKAKSVSDAGWYELVRKIEYKADRYDKTMIQIDQWYPSTQLCSNCGHKNSELKDESIREWTCPHCGKHHDRDVNAAINILNEGKRIYHELNQ